MDLSAFVQFFQELATNGLTGLVNLLTSVLPLSPFQSYILYFNAWPYIGWVNWFVPVKGYLVIWGSWLSAVGLYYIYSAILRWVKAIQ